MRFVQTFDPTATTSGIIKVGAGDAGQKVLLYNESAQTLHVDFQNGLSTYLHAWEGNYWTLLYPITEIAWSSVRSLSGAGQAPASYCDVILYDVGEEVEGVYPVQLNRLSNQGNVQVAVSGTTNVVNDNNAANTSVVEATVTGASGSNVSMDNSGNFTLKQWVAAALTQIFKVVAGATNGTSNVYLSDVLHQCEVLGNLLVDLALTVTGNATVNGNLTVNGTLSAGTLQASTLTNDGAASSTQIIEAKQSGASGSNVSIDNSGNVTLKQYVSATLTTIFQTIAGAANSASNVKLSDGNHQCEVLGSLLVDAAASFASSISVTGASTLTGNVSCGGTLSVTGASTLSGNTSVGGTFTSTGDAIFNGSGNGISVTNNANISGNCIVGGILQIKNPDSNQQAIQMIDSTSTLRDVLYLDNGDHTMLQAASSGKIFICKNDGSHVASVDSSGNIRCKGSLTQNAGTV